MGGDRKREREWKKYKDEAGEREEGRVKRRVRRACERRKELRKAETDGGQ